MGALREAGVSNELGKGLSNAGGVCRSDLGEPEDTASTFQIVQEADVRGPKLNSTPCNALVQLWVMWPTEKAKERVCTASQSLILANLYLYCTSVVS